MIQKKSNNQEEMKKVIIIANEHQYKLAPFTKKCSNGHHETIIEFIYEAGLELSVEDLYRTSSQELAFELVEQGFCVLLYNDLNQSANLTVYLPEKLSAEQRQYLEIATSMLTQCSLTVFKLDSNEAVFDHQNKASESIEALMSYINKLPEYQANTNRPNRLIREPQKPSSTTE